MSTDGQNPFQRHELKKDYSYQVDFPTEYINQVGCLPLRLCQLIKS